MIFNMTASNYFFDDGQSRKFWSHMLRGKKQKIRHGRIGTKGRENTKTFSSAFAAKEATAKLVDQKVAKGYIQVDPGKLKITRPKGKRAATKVQVAKLEKQLKAKLPDEYREFLLTQNGGQPEPDHVRIPVLSPHDAIPVGFIYGLYSKPEPFKSLLFAVGKILPQLPKGQLPVSGLFNLYYFSISLDRNPGCVYFWDEDAGGYDVDDDGQPIFDSSHAILVAGSFNEFLTRIAIYKDPNEHEGPASEIAQADIQEATRQKTSRSKSKGSSRKTSKSRDKSQLSKRRQEEILRLTYEGGEDLTVAIEQGEKATAKFLRQMNREIKEFLKTTTNKYELHFFADNWHWEANTRPMLELVRNPHIDAGTLLQIFWHGSAEDYYLFHKSVSEIENEFEKYVFRVLRQIERRIVKSEYKTASIPFDPSSHISMWDRRSEFARQIPDVMYQPISGRKKRSG
jgi:predicted DNA-binding WGR domain protein